MSKTVCVTVCKTLTLDENCVEYVWTDQELIDEISKEHEDWYFDDESVTVEVLPTSEVILGE